MIRIPGYGRMAKALSKTSGAGNIRDLEQAIPGLIAAIPSSGGIVPMHFVSFSGTKNRTEQIYSILSVYYNLGRPQSWTIYSDGTHTQTDNDLLTSIPGVRIVPWNGQLNRRFPVLERFSEKFPVWGHRLQAYLNHPVSGTTIFTDSDILFYPGFRRFMNTLTTNTWYIADTGPNFDAYYFKRFKQPDPPFVNAGFLIFNSTPDWDQVLNYIDREDVSSWEHFTDQAAIHLMLRADPAAKPLDAEYFILSCTDSFRIGVDYPADRIALRHFVSPVRHKMWQTNWKKVLKSR